MKIEVVLSKTNIILYLLKVSMKFTVNFLLVSFLSMGTYTISYLNIKIVIIIFH